MEPSVREMVLNRLRTREIERDRMQPVEEPTLAEVRQQYGLNVSDEELILRVFVAGGSGDLGLSQARPLTTDYSKYWQASNGIVEMLRRFAGQSELKELRYADQHGSFVACREVAADVIANRGQLQ
jgi:hypothetical protein